KAYYLGFRLGDLAASRANKTSDLIYISSGSSKREQIELIERLFARYGHIVRSHQVRLSLRGLLRYETIRITLNSTFNFLLDYVSELPSWILNDEMMFLAFFGGFTDAEGSFHLQNTKSAAPKGRFTIKNTDLRLLEQCHAKLLTLGLRCTSITKTYDVGRQTSKRGIFATKALYAFSVENKESVLRHIEILSPFIRHEKRRADMERVRENIEWRNSEEFQREATRKRVESNRATAEVRKRNQN